MLVERLDAHIPPAAQTSYLLFASDNNQNFKIAQMDANYYNVVQQVAVIPRTYFSV